MSAEGPRSGGSPRSALAEIARSITAADLALILLLVAASGAAIVLWRAPAGAFAVVQAGARGSAATAGRYPLDEARRVRAAGPLGETEVALGGGEVRIVSSPCANKLCVRMGAARLAGQTLVCAPNRVIVRVEGAIGASGEIDAILR
jgi:hypothetical protein